MAGIGFRIQKILDQRTISSYLKAYCFAGFISAGPWIISICALASLGFILGNVFNVDRDLYDLFFTTVTYVFAIALITTGPIQLIISRYVSERFYEDDLEGVFSSFLCCLISTLAITTVLGMLIFVIFGEGTISSRLGATFFYITLSCIWICTSFISALKNYALIVLGFILGYFFSFVLAIAFAYQSSELIIWGFTLGQFILLAFLLFSISRENGRTFVLNMKWLSYFVSHKYLALCGLFYYLGMWIDKFIHWYFSEDSLHIGGIFYSSPDYDVSIYMAFLSIAPGMAVFLIKLETDFALRMEQYTYGISHKYTYDQLELILHKCVVAINEGISVQFKIQIVITTLLLICSDTILKAIGISALQTGIFRMALIGAFVIVFYLSLFTCMFYINREKEACMSALLLCSLNIILTALEIKLGSSWYGTGFTVSAFITTIVTAYLLNRNLKDFTRILFSEQLEKGMT